MSAVEPADLIPDGEGPGGVGSSSLRDRLRSRREERRKATDLTLLVPGYQDELAIRYVAINQDEMKKIGKRFVREETRLEAAKDLVIACCDCFMVREAQDSDLTELREDGKPVRFDRALIDFFGLDCEERARDVVDEVFSPDGVSPYAVLDHAQALTNWMQGRDRQIDTELLGE